MARDRLTVKRCLAALAPLEMLEEEEDRVTKRGKTRQWIKRRGKKGYSQLSLRQTPSVPDLLSALERVHVNWYPNIKTETSASLLYSVQFGHVGPAVSLLYTVWLTVWLTQFVHCFVDCYSTVFGGGVHNPIHYEKKNFVMHPVSTLRGFLERFFEPACWKKAPAVRLSESSVT